MQKNDGVQTMTVSDLCNNERYLIPIYQRNYAWGILEVTALIDDIWDSCLKDPKNNSYYVGSLVVSKRKDGKFEVVDGQQRLTTLKILLAALNTDKNISLEFESRDVSTQTLNNFEIGNGSKAIQQVYKHCQNLMEKDKSVHWVDFKNYLLHQVKIIRTILPEDTDLNHYFEIMNNRGEQLEKHEILKARFMETLEDNQEQVTFAKIWDACSQMDGYVVKHFSSGERKALFGSELNAFPKSFDSVNKILAETHQGGDQTNDTPKTIEELLSNAPLHVVEKDDDITEEPYSSIIQFPNFLLHVLRVFLKPQEEDKSKGVVLDDKRLLEAFDKDKDTTVIKVGNAKGFAYTLLKCRFLFDQYVIKSHTKSRWTLRGVTYDKKGESMSEPKTFSKANEENVMIQAMFHVSYPTQNYKYWFDALLTHLYKKVIYKLAEPDNKEIIEGDKILEFMETLSDRFFFGRFGKDEEKSYDDILGCENTLAENINAEKYLHTGTGVHNFIFNRLDYLLWKKEEKKEDFHFAFRTSVEHFYPQNPNSIEPLNEGHGLNNFGNLCLITPSANSRFSNASPEEKKKIATNKGGSSGLESLKLQLMVNKAKEWNKDEIKTHGEDMLITLCAKQPYAT